MVKKEGYLIILSIIAIIAIVGIVLVISGSELNTNCNVKKDNDIIGMASGGLGDNGRQGETAKPGIVSTYLKIKQAIKGVEPQSLGKKAIKKIEIPEQKDSVPPTDCNNKEIIEKKCKKYTKEGNKCYSVEGEVTIECGIYTSFCTFEDVIEIINSYDITKSLKDLSYSEKWYNQIDYELIKKCETNCLVKGHGYAKVEVDCDKVPIFDKVFCEWKCKNPTVYYPD